MGETRTEGVIIGARRELWEKRQNHRFGCGASVCQGQSQRPDMHGKHPIIVGEAQDDVKPQSFKCKESSWESVL